MDRAVTVRELLELVDRILGILERLDQERIFLHEAVLRIEEKLEKKLRPAAKQSRF